MESEFCSIAIKSTGQILHIVVYRAEQFSNDYINCTKDLEFLVFLVGVKGF